MEAWTPTQLLLCAFAVAAISGLGRLFVSDKPLTARNVFGAMVFHGCSGAGLGGVGFEYLGWKTKPMALLGFSFLYGVGIVSTPDVRTVLARIIGNGQRNPPDSQ